MSIPLLTFRQYFNACVWVDCKCMIYMYSASVVLYNSVEVCACL